MEQLDRVFGEEEKGYCYARHDNPSTRRAGRTDVRAGERRCGAGVRVRDGGAAHRRFSAR